VSTLHLSPTDSASGAIRQALRGAERDDEVLAFQDDLSCGPVDSLEPSTRASWWGQFHYNASETEATLKRFWDRLASHRDRLVVWFSRHSAGELSFFLALADHLGVRPYDIVDVTGRQVPRRQPDGTTALSRAARSVSILSAETLRSLLEKEEPITPEQRGASTRDWQRLQSENAPFRVVTDTGLVSTSVDHFDPLLLAQASSEWRTVTETILYTIGYNSEPYDQVGDMMLWARLVALVNGGKLIADGDPWERSTRIRLPG
jgi:uncharacterized protein DUF3658/uncharacterized protein DUF1835